MPNFLFIFYFRFRTGSEPAAGIRLRIINIIVKRKYNKYESDILVIIVS